MRVILIYPSVSFSRERVKKKPDICLICLIYILFKNRIYIGNRHLWLADRVKFVKFCKTKFVRCNTKTGDFCLKWAKMTHIFVSQRVVRWLFCPIWG